MNTQQIVRACVRCRKQKSKCDAFRPCTQCVKAKATCISRSADERETLLPAHGSTITATTRTRRSHAEPRPPKTRRVTRPDTGHQVTPRTSKEPTSPDEVHVTEESMNIQLFDLTPGHPMGSLELRNHQKQRSEAPALPPSTSSSGGCQSVTSPVNAVVIDPHNQSVMPWSHARASAASLLMHLPPRPVTDYLVAVYFNTVHWFMIVVHEGHFLHHYQSAMDLLAETPERLSNTDEDFTFALLILTMVALGGRYTFSHTGRARRCQEIYQQHLQTARLSGLPSPPPTEFDVSGVAREIYSVIRRNATDNLACANIATIQSYLLLASLYLFHGDANLAWSSLGSTIRVAHSLGLHKERSELLWNFTHYEQMDHAERRELRWRLFWAVHTGDRFLATCYGLPPLMIDDDCTAEMPSEDNAYPRTGSSSYLMIERDALEERGEQPSGQRTTLLSYQTHKIQYYIILGEIISTLHLRSSQGLKAHVSKYEDSAFASKISTANINQEDLISVAYGLESKLQRWYNDVPQILRLSEDMTYPLFTDWTALPEDDEVIIPANNDLDENTADVQARRKYVKQGIYGIQALLLRLAYENATISIHRSVLTLEAKSGCKLSPQTYRRSIDACWRAALAISTIGNHHIFHPKQQVHAMSHVGVHLFTAGVVLSAFANADPLSVRALEAKRAIRRVIRMQRELREKAMLSAQALVILENLAREVLNKEMQMLVAVDSAPDTGASWNQVSDSNVSRSPAPAQRNVAAPSSSSHAVNGMALLHEDFLPAMDTTYGGPREPDARTVMNGGGIEGLGDESLYDPSLQLDMSALDIEKILSHPDFLRLSAMDWGDDIIQ